MPAWLSVDFVAANWQPLLVTLILGYIVGWLITGIPNKRHANEAEDRASSLDARLRKSERELTDVRREGENAKSRLAITQIDLDVAQARIHELETPPIEESVAEVENRLDEVALAADAVVEEETLDDDSAAALAKVAAVAVASPEEDETMTMLIPAVADENATVVDTEEAAVEEETADTFAAVARTPDLSTLPTAKDIALNEAYARATALQADLASADATLKARAAELDAARSDLAAANAARNELEMRLLRAREDVASELAILASTMIKMKDDQLARADARIVTLTAEADSLRAAQKALPKPTIPTPSIPVPAKPTPSLSAAERPAFAAPVVETPVVETTEVETGGGPPDANALNSNPNFVGQERSLLEVTSAKWSDSTPAETTSEEATSNDSASDASSETGEATNSEATGSEVTGSDVTSNEEYRNES